LSAARAVKPETNAPTTVAIIIAHLRIFILFRGGWVWVSTDFEMGVSEEVLAEIDYLSSWTSCRNRDSAFPI
jgi:hypothetical protein